MAYPIGNFYHEDVDGFGTNVQVIRGVAIKRSLFTVGTISGEVDINDVQISGVTIEDSSFSGGTISSAGISNGTISSAGISNGTISGTVGDISGTAYKVISVDCTDDYALTTAQKIATVINISASGISKVLTLGMAEGQLVTITNSGTESVTVKNLVADTGVTATTVKTAMFLVTSGEIIKLTADV